MIAYINWLARLGLVVSIAVCTAIAIAGGGRDGTGGMAQVACCAALVLGCGILVLL